jgi:UDP-3-O-[3-hydroxymyristoyl] glucosamine N-acyltransferase
MPKKKFTLDELASITKTKLVGKPEFCISGVNTLDEAQQEDASFLANPRYIEAMKISSAGVICVDNHTSLTEGRNYLISNNPSLTFQKIIEILKNRNNEITDLEGIHPTAIIDKSVKIGKNVSIGPYVCIGKNSEIKDNSVISSHVSIGHNVIIGHDSYIHPSVVIREDSRIGNRVIIQPGAIIGSCGFGYINDKEGKFIKLHQIGIVIIEDDVEIGANTTIDRARFKSTTIGKGTKIDNLVQIAHNVEIGKNNGIAAQTGIAGSTKTGNHIMMGGQVGIVGHVEIGDNILLATRTGVSKSLKTPGKYNGSPATPIKIYNKQKVFVKKLENLFKKVSDLILKVNDLEKKIHQ